MKTSHTSPIRQCQSINKILLEVDGWAISVGDLLKLLYTQNFLK